MRLDFTPFKAVSRASNLEFEPAGVDDDRLESSASSMATASNSLPSDTPTAPAGAGPVGMAEAPDLVSQLAADASLDDATPTPVSPVASTPNPEAGIEEAIDTLMKEIEEVSSDLAAAGLSGTAAAAAIAIPQTETPDSPSSAPAPSQASDLSQQLDDALAAAMSAAPPKAEASTPAVSKPSAVESAAAPAPLEATHETVQALDEALADIASEVESAEQLHDPAGPAPQPTAAVKTPSEPEPAVAAPAPAPTVAPPASEPPPTPVAKAANESRTPAQSAQRAVVAPKPKPAEPAPTPVPEVEPTAAPKSERKLLAHATAAIGQALGKPLSLLPVNVRDLLSYFALATLFNAGVFWVFLTFFSGTTPPVHHDDGPRLVAPGAPAAEGAEHETASMEAEKPVAVPAGEEKPAGAGQHAGE